MAVVMLAAHLVFAFPRAKSLDVLRIEDSLAAVRSEQTLSDTLSDRERRRLRREARRNRTQAPQSGSVQPDTMVLAIDTLAIEPQDSARQPRPAGKFLDDPITGKNSDSLVYDVKNKLVYIYNQGDVTYQESNLKADFMRIDMESKLVYAYGKPDSVDGKWTTTKPEYSEGSATYAMDTLTYNLDTGKAKIKGVASQQGDGWLVGGSVKKMSDNVINIENGKYTTCEQTDHPHFYLAMTKAKVIPGKKVITGPAYLVLEDVPIYFLGIPEGFFPISSGPK